MVRGRKPSFEGRLPMVVIRGNWYRVLDRVIFNRSADYCDLSFYGHRHAGNMFTITLLSHTRLHASINISYSQSLSPSSSSSDLPLGILSESPTTLTLADAEAAETRSKLSELLTRRLDSAPRSASVGGLPNFFSSFCEQQLPR